MDENQRGCAEFKRTFDNLPGVDGGMVDCSTLLTFMLDECVLAVEKENMEFLYFAVRDLRGAIIEQFVPRTNHWLGRADRNASSVMRLRVPI